MKNIVLLVAALAGLGSAATLSGTVKLPSGSGLSGVAVSLAKNGTSATTSAQGTWTLTTSTGVRRSELYAGPVNSYLSIRDGHLVLAWSGVGADGRIASGASEIDAPRMVAGRAMAVAIDTLVFKIGGVAKARLVVGAYDSTGIVTVIDTSSAALDEGTFVTTWASGCTATKPTCTSGTWKAAGPSPDRSAYKLIKESDHFALYSDGTVTDASATTALSTLEDLAWKNMFESNLFMPEPFCKDATKYKASIHVHDGDGLTGGGWGGNGTARIGMWVGPGCAHRPLGTHPRVHSRMAVLLGLQRRPGVRLRQYLRMDRREPRQLHAAPASRVPERCPLLRDARQRAAAPSGQRPATATATGSSWST